MSREPNQYPTAPVGAQSAIQAPIYIIVFGQIGNTIKIISLQSLETTYGPPQI